MSSTQIGLILVIVLAIIFYIVMFHKNKFINHHQELKDEVIESINIEHDFEKVVEE